MRANKVDTNQPKIVSDLRDMGYSVRSIAELKNACDLIVFDGIRYELFEIKNPEYCNGIKDMCQEEREAFLTKGELEFSKHFRVWIVISAKEIDTIFKFHSL